LVPYTLGRTVAFPIFKELIGYLLWVIFLTFFLYIRKKSDYKEAVENNPNTSMTRPLSRKVTHLASLLTYIDLLLLFLG
jgi:hypothetical protein